MLRVCQFFVMFIVAIYCSYAYLYFYNVDMTSFKPLYWHFLTICFALALLLLRSHYGLPVIHRHVAIWLWLFLLNNIVCYLYSLQGEVEEQALYEGFRVTALLLSFMIILQLEGAIRLSQITLILVILVAVVINVMDFTTPMWSKVPGRGAGLYENPTISGKLLVMMMIVSIPVLPKKIRLIFCVFVGIGVFVTFSRGPWLFWGVALAGLAGIGYLDFGRKIASLSIATLVAVFIVYSALTGGLLEFFASTGLDEYLTTGTLARLGGSGAAFSDYSYMSRAAAASNAWDVFANNPWFGAGLAYDQSWTVGSHNTYLRMAAEGGIFRLAIFISLLLILWNRTDSIGRLTIVIYALSSLTSHDNLRQPALLIIIALVATLNKDHQEEPLQSYQKLKTVNI